MDNWIAGISEKVGLPEGTVQSAVGTVFGFLQDHLPGNDFESLLAAVPGAADALKNAQSSSSDSGAGGLIGALVGKAGGLLGGDLGDLAGVAEKIQEAGVPFEKMAPLLTAVVGQLEEYLGPEKISQLLEQVPALKSLLGK